MKKPLLLIAACFLVGMSPDLTASAASVADFVRSPAVSLMRLSPDGAFLAFRACDLEGRQSLRLVNLQTRDAMTFSVGAKGRGTLRDITWISAERLLIHMQDDEGSWSSFAVNRDGSDHVILGGFPRIVTTVQGGIVGSDRDVGKVERERKGFSMQPTPLQVDGGSPPSVISLISTFAFGVATRDQPFGGSPRESFRLGSSGPHLARINSSTGEMTMLEENSDNVFQWILDDTGRARARILRNEELVSVDYRSPADEAWINISPPASETESRIPVGFLADDHRLLVAAMSPHRRWALYPLDPSTGELGTAVVIHDTYDAFRIGAGPLDEMQPYGPVRMLSSGKLAGWRLLSPDPVTTWFVPEIARAQEQVDAALPTTNNLFLSWSDDRQMFLVLAVSTVDPGTYYLFVPAQAQLINIGSSRDWLAATGYAAVRHLRIPARDGLEIHARLTVPSDRTFPAQAPLVVVLHDGPEMRMSGSYDPMIQCLSSQGYAVLEIDPRGSSGYGDTYRLAGQRQYGRAIETDIEDVVQAVLQREEIDAARIAILGTGIGGFSVCHALARSTVKYRCGIAIHAPGDWRAHLEEQPDSGVFAFQRQLLVAAIGDPENDRAWLDSISPSALAREIAVPMLIIDEEQRWAPPGQKLPSKLGTVLRKVRPKPIRLEQPSERSSLDRQRNREQLLQGLVDFLQRHLAAESANG